MSLMLAVDDEIVHVIYWDKPGKDGRRVVFTERAFPLRNRLLERIDHEVGSPVYVVLASAHDFFDYCTQYENHPAQMNRILIGHIQRKPSGQ